MTFPRPPVEDWKKDPRFLRWLTELEQWAREVEARLAALENP